MSLSLVAVLILAAGIAWIVLKQPDKSDGAGLGPTARSADPARAPKPTPSVTVPAVAQNALVPPPGYRAAMPSELEGLHLVAVTEIDSARFTQLVAHLSEIRRPPQALHKLVSAEYLAEASSAQLSDLVMVEPELAANVLATVNSPLYGLARPVASVGQAITYIGTTTVRTICLQYLLSASFVAHTPRLQRLYAETWNASVLGSELCFKLAHQLRLPDPGELTTRVLLSFIGRFATYSLLPEDVAVQAWNATFVEAIRIEQEHLGLSAAAFGGLLLQEWGVPESLVSGVIRIERVLVTPLSGARAQDDGRAALCYACARIGERLANGHLASLKEFSFADQIEPDFYHLAGYLEHPMLSRLDACLHQAETVTFMQHMREAMRLRS